MKKPDALNELLQELEAEAPHINVDIHRGSKVVVYSDNQSVTRNDGIDLTGREFALLAANSETIERFVEAVNGKSPSIVITGIEMPEEIVEALERNFIAVDEE
jgi:hypothetical protein